MNLSNIGRRDGLRQIHLASSTQADLGAISFFYMMNQMGIDRYSDACADCGEQALCPLCTNTITECSCMLLSEEHYLREETDTSYLSPTDFPVVGSTVAVDLANGFRVLGRLVHISEESQTVEIQYENNYVGTHVMDEIYFMA